MILFDFDGTATFHEMDLTLENTPCRSTEPHERSSFVFSFVTATQTDTLVLVHFFYPQISFVKSLLFVSKTHCSGVHIELDSSNFGFPVEWFLGASGHSLSRDYYTKKEATSVPNQNISMRECVAFTFTRDVSELTLFQRPQK